MTSRNSARTPAGRTFGVRAKSKWRAWIIAGALLVVAVLAISGVVAFSRSSSPAAPSIQYIESLTLKDWVKYYPSQAAKGDFVSCTYNPTKWTTGYTFSCNIYDLHKDVLAPTKDVAVGGSARLGWNVSIIILANN
jgi:hypothetical protein